MNTTLRKSDKLHALEGMLIAKYKKRYEELMTRRRNLAMQIYDDVFGKTGSSLKRSAGKNWKFWLETRANVRVAALHCPAVEIDSMKSRSMYRSGRKDVFTSKCPERHSFMEISLGCDVPWPDSHFSAEIPTDGISKSTKLKLASLNRAIDKFNAEAQEFADEAASLLMRLRSTKKVDEHFPELWQYLPYGLRERIKQGVVPVNQADFDKIRKQLPNVKK